MNKAIPDDVKHLVGDEMTDNAGDDDLDYESFIKEYSPEAICQGEDPNAERPHDPDEPVTKSVDPDADDDPPPAGFPEYVPTHHELLQLARYWTKESQRFLVDYYLFGFTSCSQSKLVAFGGDRLCRLERLLGGEAMQAIVKEVEDEYRQSLGDRIWEIFTKGSRAEVDALRAEISESISYGWGIAPRDVPQGLLPADVGVQDYKPETWRDFTAYCETAGLQDKLTERVRRLWEEFTGNMEAESES